MSEPKSATEMMLRQNLEGQRLERRDRASAASIGAQMTDRYFDPERVNDMADVRYQISLAAEHAAYEAIQKEREHHAEDMRLLKVVADARLNEMLTRPAQGVVTEGQDAQRLGERSE